ncbi:MAG: hypothetical protein ACOYO1_02465 [Bacteroidales bacterium]
MRKYKGFKFIPVLDHKAGILHLKYHDKERIIYYNPFFIGKLSLGQKIFLAESSIRYLKLKDIFKSDDAAFYYVNKKYGITQKEIIPLFESMHFINNAHKQDRIFNLVMDSTTPEVVQLRKFKKKLIKFFKSLILWKK